jgi:SAM-dependent methyltransferase
MDHREAGRYWDANAEVWTSLARLGYDVYRDLLNTPAFFEMLPDVRGLRGLDVGCGEGHNTRLLAGRCASLCAVDISPTFIERARQMQTDGDARIRYSIASGQELPFADGSFQFVTAFMSLMDMPRPDIALREARRVLRPGGFVQFSIVHPCFAPPYRKLLRDHERRPYAVEVGRYFDTEDRIDEWIFGETPPEVRTGLRPFRVPLFHKPISVWFNAIVDAGLRMERVEEPHATAELAMQHPSMADTRIVAYTLHARCRKP